MNLRVAIVVACVLSPSGVVSGAGTEPAKKPSVPAAVRSFLDNKCIGCHQGPKAPAGFDLKTLAFDLTDTHTLNRWVRIHDAVQRGQMPPGGKSTVKSTEREGFVRLLGRPIAEFETLRAATEGRAVLRRLNRYEYENTIRDVLSAPWLQLRDSLPEDGLVSRFNKSGQALDISHVQMARYMETAEDALRQVLRASQEPSVSKRYYARDQKRFINRMKYSPFNRHPERATIPILGFTAQPGVIAETEPISVGDKDPATRDVEGYATPAGNYVGNEHHFDGFVAPAGGKYRLGLNAFSLWIHTIHEKGGKGVMYWRPNRSKTERGRTLEPVTLYALSRGGEKRLLTSFDVGPEPSLHEIEVYLLPGEQILPDAARLFRSRPGFTGSPEATEAGMPGVAYRWMDVTGPLASSEKQDSYRVLFGDLPASRAKDGAVDVLPRNPRIDADRLLRKLLVRAYRRPPTEVEVQRYSKIISDRLSASPTTSNFASAMLAGYTAVLCSPGFLYLEETPGPLNQFALASRLSYFLWNAPPDKELRKLATQGVLTRPGVLKAQANRLLEDLRSRDFVNAFLDYWLDLRKLGETTPDTTLYPDYYLDDLVLESSLKETQMFFDTLIRKNMPASTIIHSNFTVVNARLAKHYGLPAVEGVQMREVALPNHSVRGGLLTQASVLKVTANGTTTSPVLRGAWVMERILGDPPPPPPPGIPAVEPDTRGASTIRQQLDKHRSERSCAVCHVKIDPPGFALESFDVLGAYRERYRSTQEGEPVVGLGKNGHSFEFRYGQPVDASSQLENGETFQNVSGLKKALLKDERQIARNLVNQFVAYGTGAPTRFSDRQEVERILTAAQAEQYGIRALIHGVIGSKLFTHK